MGGRVEEVGLRGVRLGRGSGVWSGGVWVRLGGGRCQGGCERRIEFFVKIKKKKWGGGGGGRGSGVGSGGGVGLGGSGWKIHTKKKFGGERGGWGWSGGGSGWWGGGGGVRVDVNEELKFYVKIKKKNWGGGRGGQGVVGLGRGWVRSGWGGGGSGWM